MRDTVPLTVAFIFAGMLAAIWAIETLEQPDHRPPGPPTYFVGGDSWTEIFPAPDSHKPG